MLEKQRTSMRQGMNLRGVHMSSLNILVIHGYGTVYELVVGLMAVSVILTLIQVLTLSCLGVHRVAKADVFIGYFLNYLCRNVFFSVLSGSKFAEDT